MSTQRPFPHKTIGILGGMHGQTGDYYRLVNQAVNRRLGGLDMAEVIVQGVNFGNFDYFSKNEMWREAGDYLSTKAQTIERAGAALLICASHTMHRLVSRITENIRIPFIHVVDPTASAVRAAGLETVGLLGPKPVMGADYLHQRYQDRFGIRLLTPHDPQQRRIDQIIFDELARGVVNPAAKSMFLDVCAELYEQGAQGVILCANEISLLIEARDMPGFPIFEAIPLHVEAAVKQALDF